MTVRDSGHPNSRFAESLKKIGYSLLRLFRGDFPVFLLFLGISFFFWWSQTMSQEQQAVLKLPVSVTDVPDDMRITAGPTAQITVSLSGKGSALRKSGRRSGHRVLNVSSSVFKMGQGRASLSTQRLRDSIAVLLAPSVMIRQIEPDSLAFLFSRQRSLMLPVEFDGMMESQDQFFLERIEFNPAGIRASVLLSDTLEHHVMADAGQITLSSDTIVKMVPVRPIPGVLLSSDYVQMTIIAQQYTEKSLEVPVTGVHFPEHITLKSFPSKAVVSAWVKMSEYDRITASDFQVVVDYNDIDRLDNSRATLRILSQPVDVRNVRLQTRTVDYLMESVAY